MGRHVTSLTGFVKILDHIDPQKRTNQLLFRGHALKSYQTQPSVFRNRNYEENEHRMIRELLAAHPREFQGDSSAFEKLVRAQHYGLPTRLLDVTRNPLVSLYFACCEKPGETGQVLIIETPLDKRKYFDSDVVSCMANLCFMSKEEKQDVIDIGIEALKISRPILDTDSFDKYEDNVREIFNAKAKVKKLVHFIRSEKPAFQPNINVMDLIDVVAVAPRKLHPRILAQDGAFLLFGLFSYDVNTNWMEDFKITTVDIAGAEKSKIISELASVGVSKETLFPEIVNSAQQIAARYMRADWST